MSVRISPMTEADIPGSVAAIQLASLRLTHPDRGDGDHKPG